MSIINNNAKEIHCKIIYYGPKGSGKKTTLETIKQQSAKNKINSYSIPFDSPLTALVINTGHILGFQVFFHIYTLPKMGKEEKEHLLKGTDGVVFVANSEEQAEESNKQSLEELKTILEKQEINISKFPLVIQYNKRDISNPLSIEKLRAQLNRYNNKDYESSAQKNQQIMEPLTHIFKSILTLLKSGEIQ